MLTGRLAMKFETTANGRSTDDNENQDSTMTSTSQQTSATDDIEVSNAEMSGTAQEKKKRGSGAAFIITTVLLVVSTIGMFLPVGPAGIGGFALMMMLLLIFLRIPIGFAMMVPSLLGLYALRGFAVVEGALSSMAYDKVASWTLSVIPMFVLMGLLMWKSGLTESLYGAAKLWLGKLPGGLAIGTNLAGAGLASVSGSTIGTTYALARIGIPEMLKAGYDKRLALGSVIVAGLPGQLIPPSIMLVIYAGIVEVPVGPQLLAGFGPGILVALVMTLAIIIFATVWTRRGTATMVNKEKVTWGQRFRSLAPIWPVPLIIFIVLGGMLSGVFTATEAGAGAALVAIIVAIILKRKDNAFRALSDSAVGTVASVGAIFLMIIGVEMLSRLLTLTGISNGFAIWVEGLGLNRVGFLLLMMVIYIILGTFMEPLPMMLLTIPILLPTIESLDISLLWFGVFVVFMGELAILTPPVGILSFVIHSIVKDPAVNRGQKMTLNDVFTATWWFMPFAILFTVILILFPEIATFIPDLSLAQ